MRHTPHRESGGSPSSSEHEQGTRSVFATSFLSEKCHLCSLPSGNAEFHVRLRRRLSVTVTTATAAGATPAWDRPSENGRSFSARLFLWALAMAWSFRDSRWWARPPAKWWPSLRRPTGRASAHAESNRSRPWQRITNVLSSSLVRMRFLSGLSKGAGVAGVSGDRPKGQRERRSH